MEIIATFDDSKYFLGLVCDQSHDFQGTGKSLRYKSRQNCVECHRARESARYHEKRRKELAAIQQEKDSCPISFDSQKYKLGKLCNRDHDFWNGFSLRYARRGNCVECSSPKTDETLKRAKNDRAKDYYRRNKEAIRQKHRQYYQETLEEQRRRGAIYRALNRDKTIQRAKRYYQENAARLAEKQRAYKETEHGRAMGARGTRRYRSRKRGNHQTLVPQSQIDARVAEFGGACAYCGAIGKIEIDHFIPVYRGGPDCLGNYLPSCPSCNSSKNAKDPKSWYESRSFYSKARWMRILTVLGRSKSAYDQMPLF